MNIAIVGTGYVGLVTGVCFSAMGNNVWCVDVDQKKIQGLKRGLLPIYEPGLGEMVESGLISNRLHFTSEIQEALAFCNLCFIAVNTPMKEDGDAEIKYVLNVAESIGQYMRQSMYVAIKSTVPVGTSMKIKAVIQERLDRRGSDFVVHMISNPEFLKEGSAVIDCMKPERVVIGIEDDESEKMMRLLYQSYFMNADHIIFMDIPSAEMTKYAANAMLASRISFMNEIAGLCERLGANVNAVRKGIGGDSRIGSSFLYAGCGYGGSCFPKDVRALIRMAEKADCSSRMFQAIESVNEAQKRTLANKVFQRFGVNLIGRTFAVWGLAFKPDTDDMREAPAVTIIRTLAKAGAAIRAYDPKAMERAKRDYLRDVPVIYCKNKYEALEGADALLLVTEWKEFRNPDFEEIRQCLKTPVIFDGRNQYDPARLSQCGIEYHQIGAPFHSAMARENGEELA